MNRFYKILTFFSLFIFGVASTAPSDKVHIRDIQTVVANEGLMTKGRRSIVPQIQCEAGPCSMGPTQFMCHNQGFDGKDATWKCENQGTSAGYEITYSDVLCEGYDHPDDPYVTAGSCGVVYGLKQSQFSQPSTYTTHTTHTYSDSYGLSGDEAISILVVLVIIVILSAAVCGAYSGVSYGPHYRTGHVYRSGMVWGFMMGRRRGYGGRRTTTTTTRTRGFGGGGRSGGSSVSFGGTRRR